MKEIFPNVYKRGSRVFTKNLAKGNVYGEQIIRIDKDELRFWDPTRSKLSAAILNGLKDFPFNKKTKILYLGASTGTTISHLSDVCTQGIIYSVEFAERVFISLLKLSKKRNNIAPLFFDARKPELYSWIEEVDVVYVDIAQPDETLVGLRNGVFLKKNGYMFIAVKSQSIDVTKKPKDVYKNECKKVKDAGFIIKQVINLEPYEKAHAMIVAVKKG